MVRSAAFIALLCLCVALASQEGASPLSDPGAEAAPVRVATIRVASGTTVYEWKDGEAQPILAPEAGDAQAQGISTPATVYSFLGFKPGDRLSPAQLDALCEDAEQRLRDSGFYYDASVFIVPPRRDRTSRTVLVRLTEGFRWRFSGGPWFFLLGQDNWRGERKSWRAWAGWNADGIEYEDAEVALPGHNGPGSIILGARAHYSNDLGGEAADWQRGEASAWAGIRAGAETRITLSLGARYAWMRPIDSGLPGIWDGGRWTLPAALVASGSDARGKAAEGAFTRGAWELGSAALIDPESGEVPLKGWARASAEAGWKGFSAALQLSAGASTSPLGYLDRFNILSTPDRSVRADHPLAELLADRYALANAELRATPLAFRIPPILTVRMGCFLYTDLALAGNDGESSNRFYDAYGLGLRLFLDNPVFAAFSFSWGLSSAPGGRLGVERAGFRFAATGGF